MSFVTETTPATVGRSDTDTYELLDRRRDAADLVVCESRTARKGQAGTEELLRVSVEKGRRSGEHRLQVHRLPERAALDVRRVQMGAEVCRRPAGHIRVHDHGCEPAVVFGIVVSAENADTGHVCEERPVRVPYLSPSVHHAVEPGQLRPAER